MPLANFLYGGTHGAYALKNNFFFLRSYLLIVDTDDLTWTQCKLFNNMTRHIYVSPCPRAQRPRRGLHQVNLNAASKHHDAVWFSSG